MPKMKTKASVKRRFRATGSGKIKRSFAAKRHGMTKRNGRMIRQARGTTLVAKVDQDRIRLFAPYL